MSIQYEFVLMDMALCIIFLVIVGLVVMSHCPSRWRDKAERAVFALMFAAWVCFAIPVISYFAWAVSR